MDANEYVIGVVLMQESKLMCYHSKELSGVVLNYSINYKELFALVYALKKWKYYLASKETIIHTNHQPL